MGKSRAAIADFNAFTAGRLSAAEVAAIAAARAANEAAIDAEAEVAGLAESRIRFRHGVVGKRPGKKRMATSGCSRPARRDHGRLSPHPVKG